MSRLADLRPAWRRIYRDHHLTADNGGFPTETFELSFTCPTCGPPGRVSIKVGAAQDAAQRVWQATPLPDGPDWPQRVTLTPSINNTTSGHGPKRPACTFHGQIVNGEVAPSP